METSAWRALSPHAQALYPWLKLEWRGPETNNNGAIRLSVRQAAECLGCNPNTAAKAFRDLQAKGFLVQKEPAVLGLEGAAKAPAYELTELALPGATTGRRLYVDWRADANFPVSKSAPNNPNGLNGKAKTRPTTHDRTVLPLRTKPS
jgi:hypothetical protein